MQDFIHISKYAGMRNDLAQAGGGNTSVKLDDRIMLVKSSGCQLADVNEENGYSKIDYRLIVDYFEKNISVDGGQVLTEEAGKELLAQAQIEGGRASIETFLHAVTGKYTLHSHPTLVNILTARKDGQKILEQLFPEAIFVPYRKPGAALAEAYYRIWQAAAGRAEVIFLENHGLVVSGDRAEQVINRTEEILHKIAAYLQVPYEACPNATELWKVFGEIPALQDKIVYLSENRFLSWDMLGDKAVSENWNHAFCPDCIVYGAKKPLFLPDDFDKEFVEAFIAGNLAPAMVCYKKHFYILAESVKKAQEIENVMSFAAQVQLANAAHEMNYLSEGQQDELLNWDSEKYRRMMK